VFSPLHAVAPDQWVDFATTAACNARFASETLLEVLSMQSSIKSSHLTSRSQLPLNFSSLATQLNILYIQQSTNTISWYFIGVFITWHEQKVIKTNMFV
jgi:hypothetical protein